MERIGVRELRQNASRYLELVKQGQTMEVTERGQLVAYLTPPAPAESDLDRLIAQGRVTPAEQPRGQLREPAPARHGRPDSADVLDELRADRR